jgi:hypothetical protein
MLDPDKEGSKDFLNACSFGKENAVGSNPTSRTIYIQ